MISWSAIGGVFGWCTSEVDMEKVFTGSLALGGEQPWCRNGCINIWAKAFSKALASGVAAAQPEHSCVLFDVVRWHVKRKAELYIWGQCCLRSRVVIDVGGGVLMLEALRDTNHACCQGQTGVSAKLVVPSEMGCSDVDVFMLRL